MPQKRSSLVLALIKQFLILFVAFTLLICAAVALPQNLIIGNSIDSIPEIQAERAANDYRDNPNGWAAQTSTYTTAIMFSIMLHQDSKDLLRSSMDGAYYETKGESFYKFDENAQMPTNVVYAYYWHGWAPIIKPLLIFFNYAEIKRIFAACLALGIIALTALMGKQLEAIGWICAGAITVGIALLRGFETFFTLPYFFVFAVALLTACFIAYSWPRRNNGSKTWLYLTFFTAGAFTSYMDFLTTPLLTYALPALCLIVLWASSNHYEIPSKDAPQSPKSVVILIAFTGFAWLLGYVCLWASKWVLASVILGRNVIQEALDEIVFRAGISDQSQWVTVSNISPLTALLNNIHAAFPYPILFLGVIFCFICFIWVFIKRPMLNKSLIVGLLIIALLPYLWYIATSNHSQIHYYFTCKNQIATIAAVLIMGFHCLSAPTKASITNTSS